MLQLYHLAAIAASQAGTTEIPGRLSPTGQMRALHEQVFSEWLQLPISEKWADLLQCQQNHDYLAHVQLSFHKAQHLRLIPAAAEIGAARCFECELSVLLEILRNCEKCGCIGKPDWRIAMVLEMVDRRKGNVQLALKVLANQCRTSAHHLGQLLRQYTGTAFREYLRAIRMRHAGALLRTPGLSARISPNNWGMHM